MVENSGGEENIQKLNLSVPVSLSTARWKPVGKTIQKSLFLFQLPTLCIYYMNSHSSVNLASDISSTTSILVQTTQYSFKSLLHDWAINMKDLDYLNHATDSKYIIRGFENFPITRMHN